MIEIREERAGDEAAIEGIVRSAFEQEEEPRLVARLRAKGELHLSLVAEVDGTIAGHIGFAPGWVKSKRGRTALAWLVPLSVAPDRQNRGIGTALVRAGLDRCRTQNFSHCIVVGDPAYYGRFGFTQKAAKGLVSRWSDVLLVAALSERAAKLHGELVEPASFAGLD